MTRQELTDQIKEKRSLLCVGLDPDVSRIPKHLLAEKDPIFEFNKTIIDATLPYAVAYKPNLAFYEALGVSGWRSLEKTIDYIPKDIFKIADAKRGDIGNTSGKYAEAFFKQLNFDAITISPYMGHDSVTPFLEYQDKWVILLASTSNDGSLDFQNLIVDGESEKLYERVIRKSSAWGNEENMMYVIGAIRVDVLANIRTVLPNHFLLIPGVGAQGGNLETVCENGLNNNGGLLINSSRSIIYAGKNEDFGEKAGQEASILQSKMAGALEKQGVL